MDEKKTYYLYCPLVIQEEETDRYGELTGELVNFFGNPEICIEEIKEAIRNSLTGEEKEHGLMAYWHGSEAVAKKVDYYYPDVKIVDGILVGAIEVRLNEMLTWKEQEEFEDEISGQLSDGWGEGFEQHPIHTEEGDLYISFWSCRPEWNLDKEDEYLSDLSQYNMKVGPQLRLVGKNVFRDAVPYELELPATEKEIVGFMNNAGIGSKAELCEFTEVHIARKDILDVEIVSIQEAQILAERLAELEEQDFLDLVGAASEGWKPGTKVSAEYLINLCNMAGNYTYIGGASTFEEVGRFLFENELVPDLFDMPPISKEVEEYLMATLDFAKIGKKYTEDEMGFFTAHGYSVPHFDWKHPTVDYVRKVDIPEEPVSVLLRLTPTQAAMIYEAVDNLALYPLAVKDVERIQSAIASQVDMDNQYSPAQGMQGMGM